MGKILKQDEKYVPVDPDPGFNADHNSKVIEDSIKKYEEMQNKKRKESTDKISERTSAIAKFLTSEKSDIKEYFGRTEMARLRGETIREQIMKKKLGISGDITPYLHEASTKKV